MMRRVVARAEQFDPLDPKLYVGGLSPSTSRSMLKGYFEQYGACSEVIIMTDKRTRRCLVFEFLLFHGFRMASRLEKEVAANWPVSKYSLLEISKGFGFVTFIDPEVATRVNMLSHIIDGRRVDCKKARPKDVFGDWEGGKSQKLVTTKIFVGGMPDDISKEEFVEVFSQYGEVVDCVIIPDTQTDMSRCFGFLQFKSPSSVDLVMDNYYDIKVRGI